MTTALFTANPLYNGGPNFRIWSQKTHDAILSTGIADASGSDSITYGSDSTAFEALANPTAYVQAGFQIYKFDDALQATAPVFIKIGYGRGTNTAYPAIYVTVGNTSDGVDTVSGPPVTDVATPLSSGLQTDALSQYMICGDTNRIIVTGPSWELDSQSLPDEMYFLSVERTKDANGDDTDEGILVAQVHNASTYYWYTMPYSGPTPANDTRWPAGISSITTSPVTKDGRQIVSPVFPLSGVAPYPGKNILITKDENFMDVDIIPIAIYGTPNNYFKHPVGSGTQGFSNPGGSASSVVLQRWD